MRKLLIFLSLAFILLLAAWKWTTSRVQTLKDSCRSAILEVAENYGMIMDIDDKGEVISYPWRIDVVFSNIYLDSEDNVSTKIQQLSLSFRPWDLWLNNFDHLAYNVTISGGEIPLKSLVYLYQYNHKNKKNYQKQTISFKDIKIVHDDKNINFNALYTSNYINRSRKLHGYINDYKINFASGADSVAASLTGDAVTLELKLAHKAQDNIKGKFVLHIKNNPHWTLESSISYQPQSYLKIFDIKANLGKQNIPIKGEINNDFSQTDQFVLSTNLEVDTLTLNHVVAPFGYKIDEIKKLIANDWSIVQILLEVINNHNISSITDLKIDDLTVNNNHLHKVEMLSYLDDGKVLLDHFSFEIPDKGSFQLSGILQSNNIRPQFFGNLKISYGLESVKNWIFANSANFNTNPEINRIIPFYCCKLDLFTDISAGPNLIRLDNTDLKLGQSNISGQIILGSHYEEDPLIGTAYVNIDNAVLPNIVPLIDLTIQKAYLADYDTSGELFNNLTDSFYWLRSFKYDLNIHSKINLKEQPGTLINIHLQAVPGKVSISNLEYQGSERKITGKLSLSMPSFRPLIQGQFNIDNVDFNHDILPYLNYSRLNTIAKSMVPLIPDQIAQRIAKKINDSSPNQLNFYSANQYDADIQLNIDNLQFSKNNFDDFKVNFALKDGIISPFQIIAKGWGGMLVANSNITLSGDNNLQFLTSFNISNGDANALMNSLLSRAPLNGNINIAGNVMGEGSSLSSILNKMQGDLIVLGNNFTINGIGLNEIIKSIDYNYPLADVTKFLDYYSKYGVTPVRYLEGRVKISQGKVSLNQVKFNDLRISGVYDAVYDILTEDLESSCTVQFTPIKSKESLQIMFSTKGDFSKEQELQLNASELFHFNSVNKSK